METKRPKQNQQYDNYWKLTVEYTDIFGTQFNETLNMIVDYIDNNRTCIDGINPQRYAEGNRTEKTTWENIYTGLQNVVHNVFDKADYGSTRKSINQFVKLGFISPFLKGYHKLAKEFLRSEDNDEKKRLFSEIFYSSASFNSSVTHDNTDLKQINFLIQTLMFKDDKHLSKNDIIGIMVTDLKKYKKGYMPTRDLKRQYKYSETINFETNKYNQINYMFTFLNLMVDLVANKNEGVSFVSDSLMVTRAVHLKRDPYMHHLYTEGLHNESMRVYNDYVCYASKVHQFALVASHLKPCRVCLRGDNPDDAYDYNNGILLTPNIDAYFDKGYISFNDDGSILFSADVNAEIVRGLSDCRLDEEILTERRREFLSYHREHIFRGNRLAA